jgi:hypothetical protein
MIYPISPNTWRAKKISGFAIVSDAYDDEAPIYAHSLWQHEMTPKTSSHWANGTFL